MTVKMLGEVFKVFGSDENKIGEIYEILFEELESNGYFDNDIVTIKDIDSYLLNHEMLGKNEHITSGQAGALIVLLFMGKILKSLEPEQIKLFVPTIKEIMVEQLENNSFNNAGPLSIKV